MQMKIGGRTVRKTAERQIVKTYLCNWIDRVWNAANTKRKIKRCRMHAEEWLAVFKSGIADCEAGLLSALCREMVSELSERLTAEAAAASAAAERIPYRAKTFETVAVHEGNRSACALADRIAKECRAGRDGYRLCLLWGESGCGKTHLLHALAERIQRESEAKVLYLETEAFTEELVRAISQGKSDSFRKKLAAADVLLVDNFQVAEHKPATAEELLRAAEELIGAGKHVVIASDRDAEALSMPQRIKNRLAAGVGAAMYLPEKQGAFAVAQACAKRYAAELSEQELFAIAQGSATPWQIVGRIQYAVYQKEAQGEKARYR